MSAIDQVQAHFQRLDTRQIEVPEWADDQGKPMIIYCTPITLAEKAKIARAGDEFGRVMMLVHALIIKAQDADGKKLFTVADKKALSEKADPDVIARIVAQLMYAPPIEEAEKNS
jgi:hypothetical protein